MNNIHIWSFFNLWHQYHYNISPFLLLPPNLSMDPSPLSFKFMDYFIINRNNRLFYETITHFLNKETNSLWQHCFMHLWICLVPGLTESSSVFICLWILSPTIHYFNEDVKKTQPHTGMNLKKEEHMEPQGRAWKASGIHFPHFAEI